MTNQPKNIVWFSWKDYWHPQAGGAEVVGHELMTRLSQDGHNVTLLTASYADAQQVAPYRIIRGGNKVSVYIWAAWYYMRNLRNKTDLVIDECNTVPFFAGWYAGCKHINFFHMLCRKIWFYELPQPLSFIGWLAEPVYLRIMKRGTTLTVSESTKADLIRVGVKANDINIISEGLELKPAIDLNHEKYVSPTVLSLGTMRSMKRTLEQVKAFEIARQSMPDLRMILAGNSDTAYGRKVLAYIGASKHKDAIKLLGKVSPNKKLEVMRSSHLLLVTSVKEGWGLVVTEANSQGTPAIAYDVDGLRDSVVHEKTGIITSENPQAMADAITNLLTQPAKYAKIRAAAYAMSKSITFNKAYADFKKGIKI